MDTWVWIVLAVVAVAIVAAVAWWLTRERRSRRLRETFGPEYDRTVTEAPTRGEAEEMLRERERRHDEFDIRPLTPAARDRYVAEWERLQARFVDEPSAAIGDADELIQQVMRERGYPVEDFEQRAADLSVDHPDVVEDYRAAHTVARAHVRGEASTEDLREGLLRYRSLFERLLETEREPVR